ncbi:MAG TPA: hypothetical protein VF587_13555 [Solirubrobacteraceae bacterium]|jgi:hypothetical protein
MPLAHELWFDHADHAGDWSFAFETLTLALLAGALVVALIVRVLAGAYPGVDVSFLGRMAPWMPFAIRMHLAVSLVGLLSLGVYLSPAMDLEADVAGILLGAVMAVVAIGMATGWHAREAAWLLIAAGPLGMLEFGVSPVLQRIDLLGLAAFVLLAGPGRWSADHERGRVRDATVADLARAVWALRVGAGVALIVVAFAEKLANPDLAVAFLAEHPELNVADQIGLGLSDLEFARVAGAIEVLFGLLLISGALPQAIVLIAGVPFNATLWFFGTNELLGHLPIYGAMLLLLVYGSDARLRPEVSRLWPFARGPATAARPASSRPRSA